MIRNWIYSHPIWLTGSIMVVLAVGLSCIGLFFFDRYVHISLRSRHNDVTGFIIAIIGVIDAVLLAFIAVAAWEILQCRRTRRRARGKSCRQSLPRCRRAPRGAAAQSGPSAARLRRRRHQRGVAGAASRTHRHEVLSLAVRRLHFVLAHVQPVTPAEQVTYAEMMRTLNELYAARRDRLAAARQGIPGVIWWIIGLGCVNTVVFSFFFGMPSRRMHYAMTGMLAGSMALVIVLIIALDWPFRGDLSASVEPFLAVRDSMQPGALRPFELDPSLQLLQR